MTASPHPTDPTALADLAAAHPAIQRRWDLRFPPAVEARYEADTDAQRRHDLQFAGLAALLIFNGFLLKDWATRPEVLPVALWWRLGVVTAFGLGILALVRRGLSPRGREWAMASTTLVTMVGACMIFRATPLSRGVNDPFMLSLILLAGNVLFQLRFVVALSSSLLAMGVAAWFLYGPLAVPYAASRDAMSLMLATTIFSLLACYRLERATRRAYLLLLRESTRSEVAVQAAGRYAALSQTDALTQLGNRRAFDEALPQRWNAAATEGQSLAALLIDIDHFKRFNDHFGHPAGDECLRQVARCMREVLRDDDFIARIGGEEFAVLLQPITEQAAAQLAERLREQVERAAIPHDGRDGQRVVSVSVGVALSGPAQLLPAPALIAAADAALYRAKAQGRNRCVTQSVHALSADQADAPAPARTDDMAVA